MAAPDPVLERRGAEPRWPAGRGEVARPRRSVGVLTFHRCINYGSYWQARSLVEAIRSRGHDAVILDHRSRRVDRAEWACALRPVAPARVSPLDRLRYARKTAAFLRAIRSLPRSTPFPLESPDGTPPCDVVVVGSDEVWNLTHPWYGGAALFWGDRVRAGRLVAYAASFGNYEAERGIDAAWAGRLRRFDAVSVRDDNSRRLLLAATGVEAPLVVDPCLLHPVRPAGAWRGPRGPFVAVYGHTFSEEFGREVRRWARARGYRLVSVGYRNAWADSQWLAASPGDFAHCMARARAVATNFFHGCIFALLHRRPFVCETSRYRAVKVRDLLSEIGEDERLVTPASEPWHYGAALEAAPGDAAIRRLERLRAASEAFLDRVLA